MDSQFVHLHLHSDGSLQDGIQTVDQIAKRASEFNMPAIALTDHGRASNLLKFKKACDKNNVKYIPGIELYVAPKERFLKEKIEGHKKTAYHLTVLAKNHKGLENIFRLTSRSWQDGLYYAKPRVDNNLIQEHSEGLIVLSGCGSGRLSVYLLEERWEEAREHASFMQNLFKDDFYIELQNHGIDWQLLLNSRLKDIAKEFNIPTVITQDSHYINKEDAYLHQNVCKLTAGDLTFDSDQNYLKSRSEMEEMFKEGDWNALDRTLEIANKCNVEWDYSKTIWPVYDLPKGITANEELKNLSYEGFKEKFGAGEKNYIDRLEFELDIIIKMGFPNYFLIVQDFINWSKENGFIPSPGRGSAAGSLVCYCLGITYVDPIKYNLLFNRFLNESRISLPDIDVDIQRDRRGELLEYVSTKYGKDKLAQIGTYSEFKPRGSLRSFARVSGHPVFVGDRLAKMVPPPIAGKDFKWKDIIKKQPEFLQTEYPEVVDLAQKAEGIRYQAGVHAAGVVIADRPINEIVPLFAGKHGEIASQFDMNDVEEIGLVKFDFLGLKTLTVIADSLKLIKETTGEEIDIYSIPDGDKETYKLFKEGRLNGIFQFETSSGFKELCMQVKPTCIEDLSACTAGFRPGPLSCGITESYVSRRNGEEFEYEIPELEPILKTTYGNIIFQEQIMRICIDLANYTEAESDNMRKIVGKKIEEKMAAEKNKFVSGCVSNKIPEEKATKLFEDIEGFAKYGFNAAHSISYSFLSYYTAWLKAHYPKEFYTSLLNNSLEKQDDIIKYITSARNNDIPLLPPDINRSINTFKLDNGAIIFGLSGIKGIGGKGCKRFLELRPETGFKTLLDLLDAKIGRKIIVALAECGALEEITDLRRQQVTENIDEFIKITEKIKKWEEQVLKYEKNLIEREDAIKKGEKPPRRRTKPKEKPILSVIEPGEKESRKDRLRLEKKTLGFYLTGHPLEDHPSLTKQFKSNIQLLKEGKIKDKETVSLPVVISSIVEKCSRKKVNYGLITVEDQTGQLETTLFSKTWKRYKNKLKEEQIVILRGKVSLIEQDDSTPIVKIMTNEIVDLNLELQKPLKKLKISLSDCEVLIIPSEKTDRNSWSKIQSYVSQNI